jgi:hypothetical protein
MAVKQAPPPGFLSQFSNPLWRAAGLDDPTAVSIVEGTRGGYPFTVLELRHRSNRIRNDRLNVVTTVFILNLGRSSSTWQNNFPAYGGVTIWVDQCYLFLARIEEDTPIADWNSLLAQAISAAGAVTDVPGPAPVEEPRIRATADRGMVWFWIVTAGFLPTLVWMWGLATLFRQALSSVRDMVLGAPICFPDNLVRTNALDDHNLWLFGLALCLPMIGQFMGLSVMYSYYGRKGFTWRLLLNGLLVGALTFGGFGIAMEFTKIAPEKRLPLCSALGR